MSTEFTVRTNDRLTVVDVTDSVRAAVPDGAEGTCTVFVEHTTAGIVVQEAEPRLLDDLETAVADFVPDDGWRHDEIDDNADAHIRATLLGEHVTVPLVDGELQLSTWQSVLLVECDGPRQRTLRVVTD